MSSEHNDRIHEAVRTIKREVVPHVGPPRIKATLTAELESIDSRADAESVYLGQLRAYARSLEARYLKALHVSDEASEGILHELRDPHAVEHILAPDSPDREP